MLNPEPLNDRFVEAARYALLRRLAPAIRHDMAGALQPISVMAAMLERRLQKPDPDLLELGKNSSEISTLSREAANACVSLMSWLAPKDNNLVPVNTGIEDAISLLATELEFRGFKLLNQTGEVQAELPRSVVRNVFMACLIALTDAAQAPAQVVLTAQVDGGSELMLALSVDATEGEVTPGAARAYRQLEWDDVQRLADAESVTLARTSHRAELRYAI